MVSLPPQQDPPAVPASLEPPGQGEVLEVRPAVHEVWPLAIPAAAVVVTITVTTLGSGIGIVPTPVLKVALDEPPAPRLLPPERTGELPSTEGLPLGLVDVVQYHAGAERQRIIMMLCTNGQQKAKPPSRNNDIPEGRRGRSKKNCMSTIFLEER